MCTHSVLPLTLQNVPGLQLIFMLYLPDYLAFRTVFQAYCLEPALFGPLFLGPTHPLHVSMSQAVPARLTRPS